MYDLVILITGMDSYKKVREFLHNYLKKNLAHDYFFLEVALNEAICNAMNYGRSDQGEMGVILKIRILNQRKLLIRIKDIGPGFAGNERLLPFKKSPDDIWDEEKLLAECGRGLFIISHSTDYMTYNKQGNELLLVKNLDHRQTNKQSKGKKDTQLVGQ